MKQKFESALLSIPDVAAFLGVCRQTVYNLIGDGEILAIKIGRATRITQASLEQYLQRRPLLRAKNRRSDGGHDAEQAA